MAVHSIAKTPARAEELDRPTLEACRRQEHGAFRTFVERYQTPVFAVISRLLGRGQRALVEELSQETFLRAFAAFPRFDPEREGKASTWLLSIATRLAIDHLRRHATWREQATEQPPELVSAATALSAVEAGELQRAFEAALAALPAEYRAVFILRTYHGHSYDEIARSLEIEVGTVKSRLSRAKQRIAAAIEEVR